MKYLNHVFNCKDCFFKTGEEVIWEDTDIYSNCPYCGKLTCGKICKVKITVELSEGK